MKIIYPFIALLASLAVLLAGTGLLGSLLALRMGLEGFTTSTIGLVMACYPLGFILASVVFGRVIVRVGHIRAFGVLSALAAGSTLIYPLGIDPWIWGLMRGVFGFCVAGLYMVVESWLNQQTPRDFRGRVLAFYSIVTYGALGGGQLLLNAWSIAGFELFSLAALLLAVSLVPLAMTRAPSPELVVTRPVGLRRLWYITPLGLAGAAAAGFFGGAFVALGPVFGRAVGLDVAQVSLLMAAAMLGGLLLQLPLGRMSDRHSRRLTIVSVAAAVSVASAAIAVMAGAAPAPLMLLALLWGGFAFTLYPLSVALANDFVSAEELVGTSAGLLLVHGVGMVAGPALAGFLMELAGPSMLFYVLAGMGIALALFGLWRQKVGRPLAVEDQAQYLAIPSTTLLATALDPRADELQLEFSFDDVVNKAASEPGGDPS